ncbi:MAG: MBL fold metallo-hydrolase [Clostridiales bacterium]|nr:MBL fold metallo-hydrolase [Clostridiales bacterium]
MQNIKVENVIISVQPDNSENYQKFLKIVKEKNINVIIANKGDKLIIEKNLYIIFLWPNSSKFIMENELNNNSIVCKLVYNNFSVLFTGDIEKIAEEQIINEYKNTNILQSTILKVAHHGSKSSSIEEFVKLVNPKIALIGVGNNNKFGHPNIDVIERLNYFRYKNL